MSTSKELPSIDRLFGLAGKVALVTGAASGMGATIAELFGSAGARIAAVDRNLDGLQAMMPKLPDGAMAIDADLSSEVSVSDMAARALDAFGRVDILVNCAGTFPIWPLAETTVERWDAAQGVNLRGPFLCVRELLHSLRASRGVILNIGSLGALRPYPGLSAYCAAKSGLIGLTSALAVELAGDGIRVNAILPGGTVTEGVLANFPNPGDAEAVCANRVLLGRAGRPIDIAAAALFLASDASSFITGVSLPVEGGFLLN